MFSQEQKMNLAFYIPKAQAKHKYNYQYSHHQMLIKVHSVEADNLLYNNESHLPLLLHESSQKKIESAF